MPLHPWVNQQKRKEGRIANRPEDLDHRKTENKIKK
jgi:hypothetical protein